MELSFETIVRIYAVIIWLTIAIGITGYILQGLLLQEAAKSQGREDSVFAWIPILNKYLLIKLTGGCEIALAVYVLSFIPILGVVCSWIFIIYSYYLNYKLLTRYGVDDTMIIIGFFIFPILFVCYYKAYKNIKDNKCVREN